MALLFLPRLMQPAVGVAGLLCCCCLHISAAAGYRPVIAIYPTEDPGYIRAYQEWLGAAGADSMIMPGKANNTVIEEIFQSVNGFLIPGGDDPRGDTVDRMVWRAVRANQEGDHFPVWGTCLGFEWLVDIFAGYGSIVDHFDAEDLASRLLFTESEQYSRMMHGLDPAVRQHVQNHPDVFYMHHEGIEPGKARQHHPFMEAFNIISTSKDRVGRPYVAQIEGKLLPVYGEQFHPEKIEFVGGPGVPENRYAKAFARHLAKFFVEEASKSRHRPRLSLAKGAVARAGSAEQHVVQEAAGMPRPQAVHITGNGAPGKESFQV